MFNVKDVESVPSKTTNHILALWCLDEPFGVVFDNFCLELCTERCKPQTCLVSLLVDFICKITHSLWEFRLQSEPVTDHTFIAVVDLEDVCLVAGLFIHAVKIAHDDFFADVLEVVVP